MLNAKISLSQIISMGGLQQVLRPQQERTRIAIALNRNVEDVRLENRLVINGECLVTFSTKPHFLKWLIFGREFYQAKFSNNSRLVSIIKLKIRRYY